MKIIGYVCATEAMARAEYKKDFGTEPPDDVIININSTTGATTVYIQLPGDWNDESQYMQVD